MNLDAINRVLDRIEEQLTEDISYKELASILTMSVYELRRIFAFVVGTPLSDYIRQRRLSCALFDLQNGDASVTEIAEKYRYESPSSFARAFREMQGISPTEARGDGVPLRIVPRASVCVTCVGTDNITFRLVQRDAMKLCGYAGECTELSDTCGEEVWNAYYDRRYHDRLLAQDAFRFGGREYAAYTDRGENGVLCTIGALLPLTAPTPHGMDELYIPGTLWGIFDLRGTMNRQINECYFKTIADWLGASTYRRDPDICNLEAFPVEERDENPTMQWQIYYPLIPKTKGVQ